MKKYVTFVDGLRFIISWHCNCFEKKKYKFVQNDDEVDEYTAAEEESDIGDDDEMYDSNMEDEENVSDFVYSDGEEEELEDIEVYI